MIDNTDALILTAVLAHKAYNRNDAVIVSATRDDGREFTGSIQSWKPPKSVGYPCDSSLCNLVLYSETEGFKTIKGSRIVAIRELEAAPLA